MKLETVDEVNDVISELDGIAATLMALSRDEDMPCQTTAALELMAKDIDRASSRMARLMEDEPANMVRHGTN